MTMIVGMNLKEYVLVASDRREVYLIDGKVDHVISDAVNKIIDWNYGYITGSGYVSILNELKENLANMEIKCIDQIINKATSIVNSYPDTFKDIKDKSNWMFTYVANTSEGNQPRVGIIEAKNPNEIRALYDMTSTVWAKIPNINEIIRDLNSKLKPISDFHEPNESIKYHISLLKDLFEIGEKNDETVCSQFNYCIQLNDGTKFISKNT